MDVVIVTSESFLLFGVSLISCSDCIISSVLIRRGFVRFDLNGSYLFICSRIGGEGWVCLGVSGLYIHKTCCSSINNLISV